jgi:hypothetical protein
MEKAEIIIQHLIFLPAREPAANFKINGESGFTPVCDKIKKIEEIKKMN